MPESKPIRILYMEDNVGLARLFKKKLTRAGHIVDLAHDGGQGLEMYKTGFYDLVAVDQRMPVHDGLEVIRILASEGPLPPTIMITGTGNEEIAIEAMKLGAGDYIVKDVDGGYLELLPSVVEQVLYQRRLIEERQKMFEELQQLNRSLALLNLAGQKLAASLDIATIMELLMQAVTETIGAEGSSVWLIDEETDELVCQTAFRFDQNRSPTDLRLQPGHGIVGWVVEKNQSVIVSNTKGDNRFAPNIDEEIGFTTASVLAVPLRARDDVIGVLELVNKLEDDFGNDDLNLVETLAAFAAIAIDNARLVETLRRQTNELQTRNAELDAFAHTVAHDLKSPLAPMVGLAQLLEKYHDTMPPEEVKGGLMAISRNGRKVSNIVDELLLLAQMHETEVELESLEMDSVVAEAEQRLGHLVEEHQAKLILPESWPLAIGYGPWIEEVWTNYISNAIKYGGNPPCLKLGGAIQENGMARFWVQDNGDGIAPTEQDKLFVPFTQLNTIKTEGHGLGLSIVQRIVEKLGGRVGVKSEGQPGQGSQFYFTLPAAKDN